MGARKETANGSRLHGHESRDTEEQRDVDDETFRAEAQARSSEIGIRPIPYGSCQGSARSRPCPRRCGPHIRPGLLLCRNKVHILYILSIADIKLD